MPNSEEKIAYNEVNRNEVEYNPVECNVVIFESARGKNFKPEDSNKGTKPLEEVTGKDLMEGRVATITAYNGNGEHENSRG